MPVIMGTVAGRIHNPEAVANANERAERRGMPWDEWERELVARWRRRGVGVEKMALSLMRPVSEVVGFDPVRPNGRRR